MHSRNIPCLLVCGGQLVVFKPWIGCLLFALTGCAQQDHTQQTIRPVNVVRITSQETNNDRPYPGEVRPRYETVLSFRVAGKVVFRSVEIGDKVKKGQILVRLDPSDYRLAKQNVEAQLIAAKAEREYSRDDLERYRALYAENTVSQPELDRRETLYIGSEQKVAALEAQLGQVGNQLTYTDLEADRDGVVTGLEVETGQVLAAGQPIVKIAQLDEKEIPIDIPEHRIADIGLRQEVSVSLWAGGDRRFKARVREIAAAADPLSRTYRAKVTLLEGQEDARFGMTATVWIPANTPAHLGVPLSAVFTPQNRPGQACVWLIDEYSATVKAIPIQIIATLPEQRLAVSGLTVGQLVVSTGGNRLREGQSVRIPQSVRPSMDGDGAASGEASL
ncbi:efflux RND transporter periplasmic adaptor subunit [Methylomonas sp. LL1]|uniref:efflux RND transporter periplasmic adaptor subunit n=1 Tax=Methylomonas sp. LL1 TaxID=2785785 RepID=UPI0018C3539C|nr:efflux RND transporter periplasmic adaptor subunit [Methylomonas sp. LL1]QPK64484.1 efflux RND transporter periplasmic adaptor subunit [Methylomonas sp. LL1]